MKIAGTSTLESLVKDAKKRGYNRQVDEKLLSAIIDPEGIHVLRDWIIHEHKGGMKCEPHIRCEVFVKCKDTFNPARVWLDVEAKRFSRLTDAAALPDALATASGCAETTPDYAVVGEV